MNGSPAYSDPSPSSEPTGASAAYCYPSLPEKAEDKQKPEILIRTFFALLYGWHAPHNVVPRKTLPDARKHPEKYKDLIVRVAGCSTFSNVLSPQPRDDITARTEQQL